MRHTSTLQWHAAATCLLAMLCVVTVIAYLQQLGTHGPKAGAP